MKDYILHRVGEPVEKLVQFPRYFEIETVNACNASCPMCTIADWDRKSGLMSDEMFEKIAHEICNHKEVKRVHLYRDGEPLLDKKLSLKIRRLKAGGVKKVGISTNVALLDNKRARSLLEAGIDEVILSVDSLKKETYESIRVGLSFDEVMNNATNFILMRNALKSSCQIWVRMIRQEGNKDEWESYERYWKGFLKETDRVDFRNLHNWGMQLTSMQSLTTQDTEKPCIALWSLMVIFADGTVPRCNVDYNMKHPVGNVKQSSIQELWQSEIQTRIREDHLNSNRTGICKGCNVWAEQANSL